MAEKLTDKPKAAQPEVPVQQAEKAEKAEPNVYKPEPAKAGNVTGGEEIITSGIHAGTKVTNELPPDPLQPSPTATTENPAAAPPSSGVSVAPGTEMPSANPGSGTINRQ